MKRITALVFFSLSSLFFLAPLSASALDLSVFASNWSVDDGDSSWGLGGKLSAPILSDHFHIEGRASYFPGNDDGGGGDLDLVPVDLGFALHVAPGSELDLYLAAGVSYIFANADEVSLDNAWGSYAGVGLEYALNPDIAIVGEALWRFAELDITDGLSSDDKYSADGVTGNIGLRFRL